MSGKYLILGLARSGLAAMRWLIDHRCMVYVHDEDQSKVDGACLNGAIAWPADADFSQLTALIQSPGVPLSHPLTVKAQQCGIKVIGDVDLFRQTHPVAKIVGITGTNGKSTTTTLVGHILRECNVPSAIGGNVGVPVMSLPELPDEGVYVLELSSYQLDVSDSLSLTVAAWLNITPDHLERHGTIEDYIYAKTKVFASKANPPISIVGVDDIYSQEVFNRMSAAHPGYLIPVSVMRSLPDGIFVYDGLLIDATGDERLNLGDITNHPRLKGRHNQQNIVVAYGICKALGVQPLDILKSIQSFPGLVHRQEYVATVDNIMFINDSKATNADAASRALSAYDSIYWIVGGVAKSDGIGALLSLLPNVKKAYLIGQSSDLFAKTLVGQIEWERCDDLESATKKAYHDAKQVGRGTVLLSPACASFDQFRDFEHRGDVFKQSVQKLQNSKGA